MTADNVPGWKSSRQGKFYRNTKTGVVAECLRLKSTMEEYTWFVLPKGADRVPQNLELWTEADMELCEQEETQEAPQSR